jgi:hypothetical protein
VAGRASAAPDADDIVDVVMGLLTALTVANDGPLAAERTPPWQQFQRERGHPGSILSSAFASAIKRITAGVKACR